MVLEFILLAALIFIFLISFCGLLQKIKQTYDREQLIAERIARRRECERSQRSSGSSCEFVNGECINNGGVFPGGPPAYTEFYMEPPPKYDDVVKIHVTDITQSLQNQDVNQLVRPLVPPPYTITISNNVNEASNR